VRHQLLDVPVLGLAHALHLPRQRVDAALTRLVLSSDRRAVQTLLTARGALSASHRESMRRLPDLNGNAQLRPQPTGANNKPWWTPPPPADASVTATAADVSEISNISRATFSRFLKPPTQPANLLVGQEAGEAAANLPAGASAGDANTHWLSSVPEEGTEDAASTPPESQVLGTGWEMAWEEAQEALLSTSSNFDYLKQGLASALDLTGAPPTQNPHERDKGSAAKTGEGKVVEVQVRPLLQTIREDVLGLMASPRGASAPPRASSMAKLVKDLTASDPLSDADVVAQARNLAHLRSHSEEGAAAGAPVQQASDPQAVDQPDKEKLAGDDKVALARSFLRGVKNMRNAAAAHPCATPSKLAPSSAQGNARRESANDVKKAPPLLLSGRSDASSGFDLTKGGSRAQSSRMQGTLLRRC
jgi:hypothetical protein